MRIVAPALILAAIPATASAQVPARHARITPDQAAAALGDPAVQDGLASALTQLAGIVLDTRVGPLGALSPDGNIRPGDTLHDLARRDDPAFDRHLHDRARGAVAATGAIAAETAELDRTAARLKQALAPLLAYAGNDDRY